MRRPHAQKFRPLVRFVLVTTLVAATAAVADAQVMVGPNVNMGGGPASFTPPSTIIGDPFLQRQNEPSIAVSSRNPCHLLAGANDYRAVDLEEAAGEVGDAWLGVFKSFDCGATWTSTLLPGHKLDTSAAGLASPIKGLAAAADATVRAGTNGMFYYSGIAFNRGDNEVGKVFVSRFLDNNNKDVLKAFTPANDPIEYLGTAQIDVGTSGQFLDKPWVVADIPRNGRTCVINGRTVPAGAVYLAYTSFVGSTNNVRSKIMFSRSDDCGSTWSNPSKLSERVARNQGTTIAVDPGTGAIYIAWREFAVAGDANTRNAILFATSTDGGKSFTKASELQPSFSPFDQASSPLTFRTNAYPTMAVVPAEAEGRAAGEPGRIYVGWAARGHGGVRPSDARIVISSSVNQGATWSAPQIADQFGGAGHQIMPALAFAGGKLALAYYDLRADQAERFEDLVMEYGLAEYQACVVENPIAPFGQVFLCMLERGGLTRRHTLDIRAAMADTACLAGGDACFQGSSLLGSSTKVSRYPEGRGRLDGSRHQLQYNRPNLPIFSRGRFPFIGDYIDIAGQTFVSTANDGWAWNTGISSVRPAPVFHVAWADNRNVGTIVGRATWFENPEWEQFTPAQLGPNAIACVPGRVGIRNQDVFTAQLRPGLVVSAPQNSKRIIGLQRSFVVVAQNTTDATHRYRMTVSPGAGVIASFDQFQGFGAVDEFEQPTQPVTELVVSIPRKSSASRTVFVSSATGAGLPNVLVPVAVEQLDAPIGTVTAFDSVFLNPDFENPDFENPDFENAELHNPDFENPDFENPDFENPDFENFSFTSGSIQNPDFENPDFENPDFENPDFENPDFENPDFENPDFENPDFENPDFENPDFENPDFENPDFENGSFEVADTTWPVRNNGNTNSAYKVNLSVKDPPTGVDYQLVVRKLFESPAAVCSVIGTRTDAPAGTEPQTWASYTAQSVPLVNLVNPVPPNLSSGLFNRDFNDDSADNATFSLAPGERGLITLRAYCKVGESQVPCTPELLQTLKGRVGVGVVSQGADCYLGNDGLGDRVGGLSRCEISDAAWTKEIYDPALTPPAFDPTDAPGAPFDPPTQPAEATGPNGAPVSFTVPTATDANGGAVVVACASDGGLTSGSVFPLGSTGVNCTATDPAGGSTTVEDYFAIAVVDTTAPAITLIGGTTLTVEAGSTYQEPGATASDLVVGTVAVTSSGIVNTQVPGAYTITYTATDGTNTAEAARLVTVADTTAPSLADSANLVAEATGPAGANVTYTAPLATDAVGATVSCTPVSGSLFAIGSTPVGCTAADAAGNATGKSFTVSVVDTTPPVIAVGSNISAEATSAAGAEVTYVPPTADDAVGAAVSCAPVSGSTFGITTTTVLCTATDAAGNSDSSSFVVTVGDHTPPAIGDVSNVHAEATGAGGALVSYPTPTATDAVGATVSCTPTSGTTFAIGTTAVTCAASDPAGNTSNTSFNVVVADTLAPSLADPANVVAEATRAAGADVTYTVPQASDAVGATVSCTPASGSEFAIGTTPVACTAADAAGNATSKSFIVSVVDTTPPTVSVTGAPGAAVEGNALGGAIVAFAAAASDLVSGAIATTCAPASGSAFPVGTTTVLCSATDGAGLTGSKSFSITVIDTTAPIVTLIGSSTVNVEAGTAYVDAGATAADIVSGALATSTTGSVNTSLLGTYLLTYQATDAAGNVGTTVRTVKVVDTTAPVITEWASPSVLLWSPNKIMTPVTIAGVITDFSPTTATYRVIDEYGKIQPAGTIAIGAGGAYSFVVKLEAYRNGNDANGRVYTVTVTAADAGGRSSTKSTVVLVPHNQ